MAAVVNSGIQVFLYQTNAFTEFPYSPNITCEDVCILCCKSLNILPTARLLFGLRVESTEKWLTPCLTPKLNVKYEFRMRFKVPELDSLLKIDPNAYEYLYRQIRHDLVKDRISDIRYPLYKNNVVGLGVVDMYIDLLENKGTIGSIEKNYKQYQPQIIIENHRMFAKKKIIEGFQAIRKLNRDLKYVKSTYMHTIAGLSPTYLREYYNATVEHLPDEDAAGLGKHYPVIVDLDPFDDDGPGIKVSLKFKKEWILVTKLENIYALYREGKRHVRLDISGCSRGYDLEFNRPYELKSFMSYVSGYFRLMTKWMFDPCVQFVMPSLKELKLLKCHGPVGGDFSYAKIKETGGKCGSYIVRQCEWEYDTYYIDINTKGKQTETFKITKDRDKWVLHMDDDMQFDKLTDLAAGIPTASDNKFRIPPSEYDKPPLMLLCLPRNLLPKKIANELNEAHLQRQRVQIFDPKEDLMWYIHSERPCDFGRMTSRLAEWVQPSGVKNVTVTLKVLNSAADFPYFMELANTWSRIYSPEFLKIYGLTLSTPYTMVMENSEYGPLNEFLYSLKNKVPLQCLLDAVHGLVRGVAFMQEKGIYHGKIRCSSLMVTRFDPKKHLLVAKIEDPGLPRVYDSKIDLPWIPIDLHKNIANAQFDLYSELWAFATTMWEIFARGQPIRNLSAKDLAHNYRNDGGILPMPNECPEGIYQAIMDGWSLDRDKRFNQMAILHMLNLTKQQLSSYTYSKIDLPDNVSDDASSIISSFSNGTEDTCQTFLNGNSCSDVRSCTFSSSFTPWDRAASQCRGTRTKNYFDETRSVQRIPNGKIIKTELIGEGHYGQVFRGEIHYDNRNDPVPVAIKILKLMNHVRFSEDFKREIEIMQTLDHPNIVKIIMSTNVEPVSIIMEYLECGSFNVYLSSQKPNLTNEKLLMFALDIAKGMEYLGAKYVIHRDLAARNILVDRERVKISDFGLAQHANNDGYYISQNIRDIPIKWYAAESIKTNKFSFYSDVWSYGVTLFEMFSRGEEPNLDGVELNQNDFLNRLEQGDRLRKPDLCPQIVYDKLMLQCWHENPKMRPNFTEIIEIIHSIKNESGERI